jgi:glutamine synthetase
LSQEKEYQQLRVAVYDLEGNLRNLYMEASDSEELRDTASEGTEMSSASSEESGE